MMVGGIVSFVVEIRKKGGLLNMQISVSPQPVVALIAGIVILIAPRLLNYIVAIYLIVFGILGLVRM